ncbi:UbiA family prenyltransferase [Ceratobasidium sp. AG-Ba]|nr:UbiA family prenyltransferase [Ceratobasidium sp. AG-Ba]
MVVVCFLQMLTFTFPLCLIAFGVNDAYDYYSDIVNPRKSDTSVEGIILNPAHRHIVLRGAIVSSINTIGISLLPSYLAPAHLSNQQKYMPTISTVSLITVFWVYSAPPLRLKERPFLDSFSNGVMIWLTWSVGFVSCSNMVGQSRSPMDAPIEIYMLSLAASTVHALAAAADIEADVSAGFTTIATVLGRRGVGQFGTLI